MMFSVMTSDTTATAASVATRSADLLRALAARYGLRDLVLGERLAGGYANLVHRLESSAGTFALRLEIAPSPAGIAWEHRVVTALAERVPEIPPPLPALDGATWFPHRELGVWLLPFVDGTPADPADERHRLEAAALLGRLHAAARELDVGPRPDVPPLLELTWPGRTVAEPLRAHARQIREARTWAIRLVRGLRRRRLTTGVIHGDFFRGNVLVAGDRAVGLLDWEEATVDWQAYDLANGVWEFCHLGGDDFDRAAGARFVAAYRAAGGPVPADEDDLLVPLIRVRRIMEVLRAPTDRHVDWEYQRHNLRAFAHLG